jgi:RimJ/RimL family protein N-acetyltransferase
MTGDPVVLRPLEDADALAYWEFQRDPLANAMADFPAREREAFDRHWDQLRSGTARTALVGSRVAGILTAWGEASERELAYWFGQEFWGRGIATDAVRGFLQVERTRPLRARVAVHNVGSRRVLEKLGFVQVGLEHEGDVALDLLVLH